MTLSSKSKNSIYIFNVSYCRFAIIRLIGLYFVGKEKPCDYRRAFEGWKTGFEPATSGTTIQRSNQLSYNHHNWAANILVLNLYLQPF